VGRFPRTHIERIELNGHIDRPGRSVGWLYTFFFLKFFMKESNSWVKFRS
jgi:hypothetical protein